MNDDPTTRVGKVPGSHPVEFPVAFKLQGRVLIFFVVCGTAFIFAGISSISIIAASRSLSARYGQLDLLGLAVIILGIVTIASALCSRIVLLEDSVEDCGLFRVRRFTRSSIRGKKVYAKNTGAYVTTIVLYPNSLEDRPMKIEINFTKNKIFDDWMSSIPDIDGV